jgi:hypothetical protein
MKADDGAASKDAPNKPFHLTPDLTPFGRLARRR